MLPALWASPGHSGIRLPGRATTSNPGLVPEFGGRRDDSVDADKPRLAQWDASRGRHVDVVVRGDGGLGRGRKTQQCKSADHDGEPRAAGS